MTNDGKIRDLTIEIRGDMGKNWRRKQGFRLSTSAKQSLTQCRSHAKRFNQNHEILKSKFDFREK